MNENALKNICKASAARSWLYIMGFMTDCESEKVNQRIRKYQDKHRQNVSPEDLWRAKIIFEEDGRLK